MDAYERLMQRYTDLTERNMVGITADLGALAQLDAIDARLTALDVRLARIEQHLGPASVSVLSPVPQVDPPQTPEPAPIQPDAKCPRLPTRRACLRQPPAIPRPLPKLDNSPLTAPDRFEPVDLRFRKPMLYPTELRAQLS